MNLKNLLILFFWINGINGWTESNTKNINNSCVVSKFKKEVKPFRQLLVYWNGTIPKNGHWQISAKVRDAKSKKWSKNILMLDWGKNRNFSYSNTKDLFAKNCHVRLETDNLADMYDIEFKAINSTLNGLTLIGATTSDFKKFKEENKIDYKENKSVLLDVPQISQLQVKHEDAHRICSPTSLTMVINYLTRKNLNPLNTAMNVYDPKLDAYGSWQYNIAYASHLIGDKYTIHLVRLNSFADILKSLYQNNPVIVSIRGNLTGALKDFPNGHLLVIVGYNSKTNKVICNDPAAESNKNVRKEYDLKEFIKAWEKSFRLAYYIDKKGKK